MSALLKPQAQPVTMTSLEIVAFINDLRKQEAHAVGEPFPSKGFAKLEHADFMKKVPEVLGERAGNFSATYKIPGPNGASRAAPCYSFPKREASLMAMSYSYAIQAKVWDHMTALEEKLALTAAEKKIGQTLTLAPTATDSVAAIILIGEAVAKVPGVKPGMAMAATLTCIQQNTGIETAPMRQALPAANEGPLCSLNATNLGKLVGLSAASTNKRLQQLGLQVKNARSEWELTREGEEWAEALPYNADTGHSGYQILWNPLVVEKLRKAA